MMRQTEADRLAALEFKMAHMQDNIESINEKLDELLTLKNKGIGAFWLASTIVGTGIIGLFTQLYHWWST